MSERKWLLYSYLVLCTAGTLGFLVLDIVLPVCSQLRRKEDTTAFHPLLDSLAFKALAGADVPVAACLVYQGWIIGSGFNTVYAGNNICGHAELNAINDAVHRLGIRKFERLNKNELQLISTFEPCAMCKGAAIEYGITHVVSVLPKRPADRYRQWITKLKYEYHSRLSRDPYFQYRLFTMHPAFDSLAYPFSE